MLLDVLYAPFLAPLILCVTAPAYVALFWLWGRLCGRHPWLDRSGRSILVGTALMSLPPALATAVVCGHGPLGVFYGDVLAWLPFCIAMVWGAMVSPRWLLHSLRPGVFSETPHGACRT